MKPNKPEDIFRAEKERSLTVRNSLHARLLAEAKAAFDKLMAEGQAARKSGRPRKHPLPPLKTSSSVRLPLKPMAPPPLPPPLAKPVPPAKPAALKPAAVKLAPRKPAPRKPVPTKSAKHAAKSVAKGSTRRVAKKTVKGGASKSKPKRPTKR